MKQKNNVRTKDGEKQYPALDAKGCRDKCIALSEKHDKIYTYPIPATNEPDNEDIRKQAVWLIEGYKPTDAARGVFAAAKMNTTPYPMLPYAGLMHSAIGKEIADFMQGKETADKTLSDIEDAYRASAKEKGFL